MTRSIILRLSLIFCLALGYAACGQKGDLYMPEKAEADQASATSEK